MTCDPLRESGEIAEADLRKAQEAVERLRPLASDAVLATFGQVMTAAVQERVGRGLGR